jgi:hypothetical protein
MRIECSCGKALKVPEHLAGKKIRCPTCSKVLVARIEEEDAEPEEAPRPANRRKTPAEPDEDREDSERSSKKKSKKQRKPEPFFLSRYGMLFGIGGGAVVVGVVVVVVILNMGGPTQPNQPPANPGVGGKTAGGVPSPQAPAIATEAAKKQIDELIGWTKTLEGDDFTLKSMERINELNRAKQGELAAAGLIELLKSDSIETRIKAARALNSIGVQAQKFIPEMIVALKDPEYRVRRQVTQALGWVCTSDSGEQPKDTPKVVQALIPMLEQVSPPEHAQHPKLGALRLHPTRSWLCTRLGPPPQMPCPKSFPC